MAFEKLLSFIWPRIGILAVVCISQQAWAGNAAEEDAGLQSQQREPSKDRLPSPPFLVPLDFGLQDELFCQNCMCPRDIPPPQWLYPVQQQLENYDHGCAAPFRQYQQQMEMQYNGWDNVLPLYVYQFIVTVVP